MRKCKLAFGLIAIILAGCNSEKGKDFIGHWEGQESASRTSMDIAFSDGIYHVDYHSPDAVTGKTQETNKLEALAASDTVLVVHGQLGDVTIRMEGNSITLENHKFVKTK